MLFEAFSVAVSIRLINGASSVLRSMTADFMKAHDAAGHFQARLDRIGRKMAVGTAMTGAGMGILASFKPALNAAKQFEKQTATFALYGMGDRANGEATKFAKSMNIMGASYTDAMRLMVESQGVFRESGKLTLHEQLEGAKIATPILAKLAFIRHGLSPDKKEAAVVQDKAMLRFIESRGGANDPRTFAKIADWGFKLSQSSGGIVDWSQLQQFTATAGASGFNLSQEALTKLEPVLADLRGGGTGSGLRVAFQRLLGTQRGLPRQAVQEYLSLGLWDPSKLQLSAQGGIKRFTGRPGEVLRDREKFASDPVAFYTENFLPAIVKKYGKGILGDSATARTERAAEINLVFGPGTAGSVFSQIDKLLPAILRSEGAQAKQLGIDASYSATGKTLSGKEVDLHAKFNSLMVDFGTVALPLAVRGLELLIPMVKGVSDFATKHPGAFKVIVTGLLGLGAALMAGGLVVNIVALGEAIGVIAGLLGGAEVAAAIGAAPAIATGVTGVATSLGLLGAVDFVVITGGLGALLLAAMALVKWGADHAGPSVAPVRARLANAQYADRLANSPHMQPFHNGGVWDQKAKQAEERERAKAAAGGGFWERHFANQSKKWAEIDPANPNRVAVTSASGASAAVPSSGKPGPTIQVHSTVTLDGRTVAKAVTDHQTRSIGGPQTGTSGPDPRATAPTVGAKY